MSKKILVAARSFAHSPEAKAVLEAQGYELVLNPFDRPLTETELVAMIQGMDALVTGNDNVTAAVIAAGSPSLKIIAKHGVGYNNIDVAAAGQYGIPVTISPGANSTSVAELALGLMLALTRHVPQLDRSIRAGSWGRITGGELEGKVLGIVGMGRIGEKVTKRAHSFGMKVIAYDVYPKPELVQNFGVEYLPMKEVFARADFLSLHAPALPETVGMINAVSLRTMKSTAFLINTARGDLIDEAALCDALEQRIIAGAALDVFDQEPPTDARLFSLDNVVLTPHIGANTREAIIQTGVMAAEEVVRVLSGQAPKNPVL